MKMENDLQNKFRQYQILNRDIDDMMNFYYKLGKVELPPYNMHFQVMLHQLYRQYILYNIVKWVKYVYDQMISLVCLF